MDVADRQIFRGADFRRRQRGDRRKDNIPLLEERAEVARGGVKDRLLDGGCETSPTQLSRRMHNKLLAAARCIRATLFEKIDDLQFASLRVHIHPETQPRRVLGCAVAQVEPLEATGS
jgi:hypothetical protein